MTHAIPNAHRFFVSPSLFTNHNVVLQEKELVHQINRVLRMQPGDRVMLLDGTGIAYEVTLTEVERGHIVGNVEQQVAVSGELQSHITLFVALLRSERFEWVLQKGTELGVQRFIPVHFARSLLFDQPNEHKLARWQRIVQEAAEQSCRGRLPEVAKPISFAMACCQAKEAALALLLWEGNAPSLRSVLRDHRCLTETLNSSSVKTLHATYPFHIAVLSGPEGGITEEELTTAQGHGMIPISLGPRILRAETAPLAAIAAMVYELEG